MKGKENVPNDAISRKVDKNILDWVEKMRQKW